MPIFIPALIQAGLALARAAIPAATRLLTQAGATAARATTTAGNAMRAAGPIPFVAAGVGGPRLQSPHPRRRWPRRTPAPPVRNRRGAAHGKFRGAADVFGAGD